MGLRCPDQGKGGKFLLLPPGYKGDRAGRYFVIKPRTYVVLKRLLDLGRGSSSQTPVTDDGFWDGFVVRHG